MTSGFEYDVEGMDALLQNYTEASYKLPEFLANAMADSVAFVANDADNYPAESSANQPPPPYYIRGVGTQYVNGNRGESEQMDKKWQKTVEIRDDGVIGTVENTATYAPWVHSMARQIPIHASRNWRKVDKIAEDTKAGVLERFQLAAKVFVDFFGKARGK